MKRIASLFVALFWFLFFPVVSLAAPVFSEGERSVLPSEEVVDGDYFAAGESVVISGEVNGDVYSAGGTITIDGVVNGDLLIGGGTVNLDGEVTGDVRAGAGNIIFGGSVGGNVTVGAGTVRVLEAAEIGGNLVGGAGTLDVNGPVNGDVTVGVGAFSLSSTVGGDLTYASEIEYNLLEGGKVLGEVEFTQSPATESYKSSGEKMAGFGSAFNLVNLIGTLIVGLILIKLAPKYSAGVVTSAIKKPWKSLFTGFSVLILVPISMIILFMTVIGMPLAGIILLAFGLFYKFAKVFAFLLLGDRIVKYFSKSVSKNWTLVIGGIAYSLLLILPVVGWTITSFIWLISFGALITYHKKYFLNLQAKKLV